MGTTEQEVNQEISDKITQLQIDLESALQKILEQANSKKQRDQGDLKMPGTFKAH